MNIKEKTFLTADITNVVNQLGNSVQVALLLGTSSGRDQIKQAINSTVVLWTTYTGGEFIMKFGY